MVKMGNQFGYVSDDPILSTTCDNCQEDYEGDECIPCNFCSHCGNRKKDDSEFCSYSCKASHDGDMRD